MINSFRRFINISHKLVNSHLTNRQERHNISADMYKIRLSKKHIIKDHSDRFDQFEPVFYYNISKDAI